MVSVNMVEEEDDEEEANSLACLIHSRRVEDCWNDRYADDVSAASSRS